MTLLDWRRRVAAIYADVRATADADPALALTTYRAARDDLFRIHPDSPLPAADRATFPGIPGWDHDPDLRFEAVVEPVDPEPAPATSLSGHAFDLVRVGRVRLPVGDLAVYWISVYGGGIFVPFRDGTSGTETYGAGRYLIDTIKGADLGGTDDRLVLDFNYAYHPSCAYDARWVCPLASRENWLEVSIRAGERLPDA